MGLDTALTLRLASNLVLTLAYTSRAVHFVKLRLVIDIVGTLRLLFNNLVTLRFVLNIVVTHRLAVNIFVTVRLLFNIVRTLPLVFNIHRLSETAGGSLPLGALGDSLGVP